MRGIFALLGRDFLPIGSSQDGKAVSYLPARSAARRQRKPQPVKTVWAIGSMEWQAEQEKADRTAASVEPLSLAGDPAAGRDN
jgi:hypothetical protein